jgi:hypothetical protein
MGRDDELDSAHERLRLATAAYAEMISDEDRLQSDAEADEVLRRQLRAQVAWENYLRLQDA